MKRIISFFAVFLFSAGALFPQDKLILLCGVTMRFAVEELTQQFAEDYNVEFEISYGGSGNLKSLIQDNKVGDLFLPGSDSYIHQLEDTGEVTDTAFVGENKAALVVAEGNPARISGIEDLANWDYGVVLARADSGSIGREAAKILTDAGILDDVMDNALYLTTDSKDLDAAIKNGDADVTINWKATSTWPENRNFMDAVDLPEASAKRLVFGLLTYSRYPDMAKKFLDYAASPEGRAVFKRNGF